MSFSILVYKHELKLPCARADHSHTETFKDDRKRENEKRKKVEGVVRDTTFWGEARNYISTFKGFQAVPVRPSI